MADPTSASKCKPHWVEGAAVLDHIYEFVRRFVSLSDSQARIVSLWVVHTHVFSAADATPYLAITSAEKESGKTRLLEVLEILVANPWLTGRVTAAVLIRKIDALRPTLLLDESDATFGGDKEYAEALRGVLNTGHRNGGKASCCVGQGANITFRDFSTFCPKAFAGIGKLPDTVAGRAIPIRLKRATMGEGIQRFRRRDVEQQARALREQLEGQALPITETLLSVRPELPFELTDRQQDAAEPLLAIADQAGGTWPFEARRALVELCAEAQVSDDSIGRVLLSDIHQVFESQGVDKLSSADLAYALAEIETSSWGEWFHGKPLSTHGLARLLKPFEVFPECIRIGDLTPRGYLSEQFQDAFRRYLRTDSSSPHSCSAPQSATPQQTTPAATSAKFRSATVGANVADQNAQKPASNGTCCGVMAEVEAAGVSLRLDGEGVRIWFPEVRLRDELASQIAFLRRHRSEVTESMQARVGIPRMPPGVRLVKWNLKEPPVAIESCAVVTEPGLFARTTIEQLRIVLANPKHWVGWSVVQLIERLGQVGVTVDLETNHSRESPEFES